MRSSSITKKKLRFRRDVSYAIFKTSERRVVFKLSHLLMVSGYNVTLNSYSAFWEWYILLICVYYILIQYFQFRENIFLDNLALKFMVEYFCYHVSDIYVDLSTCKKNILTTSSLFLQCVMPLTATDLFDIIF